MGRKTNSISLRLKKTNRDFNDCWYGDILYSESVCKSLHIKKSFSQTLKSACIPCVHLSVIGAFKKSNVFVGYLDAEPSRKRRCEALSLKMQPRLPDDEKFSSKNTYPKYAYKSRGSREKNCTHPNLEVLCLPISTNSGQVWQNESFIFQAPKRKSRPLSLIQERHANKKTGFHTQNSISATQYACLTASQNHKSPLGKTSVFAKRHKQDTIKKHTFHNFFRVCSFLYSVYTVRKYCGALQAFTENQTHTWFSQRKGVFCATEVLRELYGAALPLLPLQSKGKALSSTSKRLLLGSGLTEAQPQSAYVEKINPYFRRLKSIYSYLWGNSLSFSLYKSVNEKASALFLANSIAYYLERKVPFRRLKAGLLLELCTAPLFAKKSQKNLGLLQVRPQSLLVAKAPPCKPSNTRRENSNSVKPVLSGKSSKIAGIRVSCSGRVGGKSKKAQRSRKETLMWGETGLHVFSSKLDFARTHAETTFGSVGIQVWICYK